MGEAVIKTVDPQGRLVIPTEMRKGWKSGRVMLVQEADEIRIVPLEAAPPSAFFDSIPVDDDVDLTDARAVMKSLRGKRRP